MITDALYLTDRTKTVSLQWLVADGSIIRNYWIIVCVTGQSVSAIYQNHSFKQIPAHNTAMFEEQYQHVSIMDLTSEQKVPETI